MNYTFCSRTHPGQVRENNEDSVAIDDVTQLVVLADGMGGYNAGEIASAMATGQFTRAENVKIKNDMDVITTTKTFLVAIAVRGGCPLMLKAANIKKPIPAAK